MNKRNFILIFILVAVCLILVDVTVMDGALTRNFLALFIREGMYKQQVADMIGTHAKTFPHNDKGMSQTHVLPFDRVLLISYNADCLTVSGVKDINQTWDDKPIHMLYSFLLPGILLFVAGVEVAVYFALRRHSKKTDIIHK